MFHDDPEEEEDLAAPTARETLKGMALEEIAIFARDTGSIFLEIGWILSMISSRSTPDSTLFLHILCL